MTGKNKKRKKKVVKPTKFEIKRDEERLALPDQATAFRSKWNTSCAKFCKTFLVQIVLILGYSENLAGNKHTNLFCCNICDEKRFYNFETFNQYFCKLDLCLCVLLLSSVINLIYSKQLVTLYLKLMSLKMKGCLSLKVYYENSNICGCNL